MNYLAFIEQDGDAWGGFIPELNASATGKSREQVCQRLAEGGALTVFYAAQEGTPAPLPSLQSAADLPKEDRELTQDMESVFMELAPINPVSLEIERAVKESGLSDSEIARRMGSSPAAVGRLQDAFYWGHSLTALRKLADVLGVRIELKLLAA